VLIQELAHQDRIMYLTGV